MPEQQQQQQQSPPPSPQSKTPPPTPKGPKHQRNDARSIPRLSLVIPSQPLATATPSQPPTTPPQPLAIPSQRASVNSPPPRKIESDKEIQEAIELEKDEGQAGGDGRNGIGSGEV